MFGARIKIMWEGQLVDPLIQNPEFDTHTHTHTHTHTFKKRSVGSSKY